MQQAMVNERVAHMDLLPHRCAPSDAAPRRRRCRCRSAAR
jgi:hypothetical protein